MNSALETWVSSVPTASIFSRSPPLSRSTPPPAAPGRALGARVAGPRVRGAGPPPPRVQDRDRGRAPARRARPHRGRPRPPARAQLGGLGAFRGQRAADPAVDLVLDRGAEV